jgi:phage pi2 protein 07
MSFVKLSEHEMRKAINNDDGIKRMIHSIGSSNYLKIENGNMVEYMSPLGNETSHRVTIQQQYLDHNDNTYYNDIFEIKLEKM